MAEGVLFLHSLARREQWSETYGALTLGPFGRVPPLQSTNRAINQSIKSIIQAADQPRKQINQLIDQSTNRPINQLTNQSTSYFTL